MKQIHLKLLILPTNPKTSNRYGSVQHSLIRLQIQNSLVRGEVLTTEISSTSVVDKMLMFHSHT